MIPKSFHYLFGRDIFLIKMASPGDAESLHQSITESIDQLKEFCDWAHLPQSVEAQRRRLEATDSAQQLLSAFQFHIFLHSKLIGCFSLHQRVIAGALNWEIGYWIHSQYVGRGIGQLALDASLWVYTQALDADIYLMIHPNNIASLKIADKNSFVPLGTVIKKSNIDFSELPLCLFGASKNPRSPLFISPLFTDFDCEKIPGKIQKWKTNLLEVQF